MTLEGVTYFRFRPATSSLDALVPGAPWIFDDVSRELKATFTRAELPAGTNVYVEAM